MVGCGGLEWHMKPTPHSWKSAQCSKLLWCKHSSEEGVSLSFFIKENYLEEVDTIYILKAI
jgi:hypothetical protein